MPNEHARPDDYTYSDNHARRRCEQRESECRGAASYLCNPTSRHVVRPCGNRICARQRICAGQMRECEHSAETVLRLCSEGFVTIHLSALPECVANSDLHLRRRFETLKERFRKALQEETEWRWPSVAKAMQALGWNRLPG